MKALLFPYAAEHREFDELFPAKSLYGLPLAGKMIAEYWVDLCSMLRIRTVSIQDYAFDPECRDALGGGEKWSLELTYAGASICGSLAGVLDRYAAFLEHGPVLIAYGAVLPALQDISGLLEDFEPVENPETAGEGVYLLENGILRRCLVPLYRFDGLKSYFELNFRLLSNPGIHVLPGYSAEAGIHTGMNVAILPECVVESPAMLCDNVRFNRGCVLSGGVIVGGNAVIDRGTALKHAIVMNHTFVGMEMEIENKIVAANRVIDPESGAYVDHADGITMGTGKYRRFDWLRAWEFLIAFSAAVILLPFYVVLLPLCLLFRAPVWKYRLSLDRYPKLWLVISGRGRLIRMPGDSGDYVFLATEGFSGIVSPEQVMIDDLYFRGCRSAGLILRTFLRSFINRSLSHEIP